MSINALSQVHSVGIHGGINLSNVKAKDIFESSDFRSGLIGGLSYELQFYRNFLFEVDLSYIQQGFSKKLQYTDPMGEEADGPNTKFNYNYISMPIKIGYSFGEKFEVIPKIGVGPAILWKAVTIVPDLYDHEGNKLKGETMTVTDVVSKFDFSGIVELGLSFSVSDYIELCPSLSYRYSITQFSNSNYFDHSNMHHYGFTAMAGLRYRL